MVGALLLGQPLCSPPPVALTAHAAALGSQGERPHRGPAPVTPGRASTHVPLAWPRQLPWPATSCGTGAVGGPVIELFVLKGKEAAPTPAPGSRPAHRAWQAVWEGGNAATYGPACQPASSCRPREGGCRGMESAVPTEDGQEGLGGQIGLPVWPPWQVVLALMFLYIKCAEGWLWMQRPTLSGMS